MKRKFVESIEKNENLCRGRVPKTSCRRWKQYPASGSSAKAKSCKQPSVTVTGPCCNRRPTAAGARGTLLPQRGLLWQQDSGGGLQEVRPRGCCWRVGPLPVALPYLPASPLSTLLPRSPPLALWRLPALSSPLDGLRLFFSGYLCFFFDPSMLLSVAPEHAQGRGEERRDCSVVPHAGCCLVLPTTCPPARAKKSCKGCLRAQAAI